MAGDTMPQRLYKTLYAHYGDPHWWPARTPYEVMVGAVLTQNTAWSNVEKAIAGFGDDLSPQRVACIPAEQLRDIIRPSGFFVRKADTLKTITAWYAQYDWDVGTAQQQPMSVLRAQLLALRGIGPETADSILLYAFGFSTFVVDTYTMRLCRRYPLPAGEGYEVVKAYFEQHLPRETEVYNQMHALIVVNAKAHCRAKPVCTGCPLHSQCEKKID